MTEHLQGIRVASDEMLRAAREERWEDLGELDARRAAMIQAWSDVADSLAARLGDDTAEVEVCLRHIVEVNNEIMELAEQYRNRLAEEIADNRQQRQAAVAYATAAR